MEKRPFRKRELRENDVSVEKMKIALGWLRDELSTGEVQRALDIKYPNNAVYYMAIALRQALRAGAITVRSKV